MRLTKRGRIVVTVLLFALAYTIASVPALWWTDNPIAIR